MKGQPIAVALGFVCAFGLGWAVRGFQQPTPTPSDGLARMTIDGHTIEYPSGSGVEFESFGNERHDAGTHNLARDADVRSGGLSTNSERVAQNYQQTEPTDGMGAFGGGIVSSVEAFGGNSMNVLYIIGALAIIGGAVVGLGLKRPMLGLGLAAGGVGVIVIAYFAAEQPLVLWLLGILGLGAAGWWLWTVMDAERKRKALEAVTGAVEAAKRVNPEAAALVKQFVPDMAGDKNLPAIKREIEKAKA